jgi:hypothetical protein
MFYKCSIDNRVRLTYIVHIGIFSYIVGILDYECIIYKPFIRAKTYKLGIDGALACRARALARRAHGRALPSSSHAPTAGRLVSLVFSDIVKCHQGAFKTQCSQQPKNVTQGFSLRLLSVGSDRMWS